MNSRGKRRRKVTTASSRARETKSCHGDHQRRRSDTKGWEYLFYRRLCHAEAATAEPKNTLPSRHAAHSSLNSGPFEFHRSGKYLRDWNERAPRKKRAAPWRLRGAYNAVPSVPESPKVFLVPRKSLESHNFYLLHRRRSIYFSQLLKLNLQHSAFSILNFSNRKVFVPSLIDN